MNMLFVLIILSLSFLGLCVFVFFWAIRSKQFNELEIQGFSVLEKDEYETDAPEIKNQQE